MKNCTLTFAQYFIHLNKWLYTKEPKGKTKPQEIFLAFFLKMDMTYLVVDFMYVIPCINYYTESHE